MLRYFVLALSLCLVAGADNEQPSNGLGDVEQTPEFKEALQNADNLAPEWITYEQETSKVADRLSKFPFPGPEVDPNKILFTLYSGPNTKLQWTFKDHEKLNHSAFNPDLPTHFLVHGSFQGEDIWEATDLSFEYGIRGKRMNLITVDWSQYSCGRYETITIYVGPQISLYISQMIEILRDSHKVTPNQIRMTGFGIGAHIAGLAAKRITPKISRVTGLDPVGFLYNLFAADARLDKQDAESVDVIYTNMGGYGMSKTVGTENFMPCGGRKQKPCENLSEGKNACSHHIALDYFKESVNKGTGGFIGKSCANNVDFRNKKCFLNKSNVMGEDVIPQVMESTYYLEVNEKVPYSKGVNGAYLYSAPLNE